MSLINLLPGRLSWLGWSSNWFRLWHDLSVLDGLVPTDDGWEIDVCWRGETGGEVGTVGNGEIIPEVSRIEWGWGWCSWYSCIPSGVTIVGSEGPVWVACAQFISYATLGEVIL